MRKRATVVVLASLAGHSVGSRDAHAAPPAAGMAPKTDAELLRLRREETAVGLRYDLVVEARRRLLHLLADLESWKRTKSADDAATVVKSVAAYREACAFAGAPVEPAELDTAASATSIDVLLDRIKCADRALCCRVTAVQDERRNVNRLITAIEEMKREATPRNVAALAKARELYAKAKA
jgi:hypothetical protein